ncbi:L-threonylcarbamoyladenylate synthase [Pseudoalteromonas peptidolytica F12-50-A1]|uniref:Threonylcarbamoyl-AMP synthase n=1 Tax=Pseudoalteromonas peptidolytica F12-50-A1 TaxID=1315280 RepID=A0A8I0MSP9_9GAMM|nr:L-threonylcarbamoyladenylate synthase [Pseudoalteromonas peptidolytica F12-50-A1]GEK10510.1 threonylcarbamoyl-AMP synthase [Pseudoalteromonas peptidolytica]
MPAEVMSIDSGNTVKNDDKAEASIITSPESALQAGEVICYPTEAIFGLGCDPDNEEAVAKLLEIKSRPIAKGLILIADNYGQCLAYVDDNKIPMDKRAEIFSAWPGAITWLLPAKPETPHWLTGGHDTIAVRVTDHPIVKQICQRFGKPIVSTSANITGETPVASLLHARNQFGNQIGYYVDGELGTNRSPSVIKHAITGAVIRG